MKLGEHEMKSNQSVADEIRKYMNYIYLILFAGITMWYYLYSTVLEYKYPYALYLGLRYAVDGICTGKYCTCSMAEAV